MANSVIVPSPGINTMRLQKNSITQTLTHTAIATNDVQELGNFLLNIC